MALASIPSVVSIPPNRSTAALDTVSTTVSPPPAWASPSSEASGPRSMVASRLALRAAKASFPSGLIGRPAETPETESTMAPYQARTSSGSAPESPSASTITEVASGAVSAWRRSARPSAATASSSRSHSASTNAVKRSRTGRTRNGRANGARWRSCSAPSSESMLVPTTWAVEKRSSSTVKVASSRMTCSASSRLVTSHAESAGTHATGSLARRRARSGCGSRSSSSTVAASPAPMPAG